MKLVSLIALMVLASCASKKVPLSNLDYDASEYARIHVNFLKDKSDTMDIGATGLSLKQDMVVIKKDEIECGKGSEKGFVKKLQKVKEPYLIFSKTYKEFVIVCENENFKNTAGNFYLNFKNIYSYNEGMPGKVLASNVKVEVK